MIEPTPDPTKSRLRSSLAVISDAERVTKTPEVKSLGHGLAASGVLDLARDTVGRWFARYSELPVEERRELLRAHSLKDLTGGLNDDDFEQRLNGLLLPPGLAFSSPAWETVRNKWIYPRLEEEIPRDGVDLIGTSYKKPNGDIMGVVFAYKTDKDAPGSGGPETRIVCGLGAEFKSGLREEEVPGTPMVVKSLSSLNAQISAGDYTLMTTP